MEATEIKVKVKSFMKKVFKDHELDDDENIFEKGFVNSLFAMQMVMFVEKEFSITIENEDLDLSNFSTVNAICKLIESKIK